MGAQAANNWEPYMLLAAAGGFFLLVSIIMFATVAVGTLFANEKVEDMSVEFATPSEISGPTPAMVQSLFRWGAVALVLAIIAYAGPLADIAHNPGSLAPGMRTW